jgi:alpha-amylase
MNILGDFINRVNALYPPEIENDELNALLTTIRNQGDEIEMKDKEITRLKARLEKLEPKEAPKKAAPKKAAPKKAAPKKAAPKKAAPVAEPKAEEPKVEEPKAEEKK